MSPKNEERRERRSPDSTLLAHPTILPLMIQENAKKLYNPVGPQLKSQIAAKTDLMHALYPVRTDK